MSDKQLKEAWIKFNNGDPISDSELLNMIEQAESAILYLEDRGVTFFLATSKTRQDLQTLYDYRFHRVGKN